MNLPKLDSIFLASINTGTSQTSPVHGVSIHLPLAIVPTPSKLKILPFGGSLRLTERGRSREGVGKRSLLEDLKVQSELLTQLAYRYSESPVPSGRVKKLLRNHQLYTGNQK